MFFRVTKRGCGISLFLFSGVFYGISGEEKLLSDRVVKGDSMKDEKPVMSTDNMYLLLRESKIKEFNELRSRGQSCDLSGKDFRGLDLRGMDVAGVDFSNSYFRQTDLRGLNLTSCSLAGASIHGARISGTYFPDELTAQEIELSHAHGTRMRYTGK